MTRREVDAEKIHKLMAVVREAIDLVSGKPVEDAANASARWTRVLGIVDGFTFQEKERMADCEVPWKEVQLVERKRCADLVRKSGKGLVCEEIADQIMSGA
jgi:hypothetical protein